MDKKAEIRHRVAGSTIMFGRVMMPEMFNLKPCPMHYDLDRDLENQILKRINYRAPRDHAKTTILVEAFPLKEALTSATIHKRRENILIIGLTEKKAIEALETIKYNLDYNEKIREVYGVWGSETAKKWAETKIILADDTIIQAKGMGQAVLGLKHLELRPTIVLVDDPEDENNTKTAESMEANLRWLLGAVVPLVNRERGRIIVIGTPKHDLCMVETLAKNSAWKSRLYDAITDEDNKQTLWPDAWSWGALMDKKEAMGLRLFTREYRCQVVGSEEQLFREEYFRYYDGFLSHDEYGNSFMNIGEDVIPVNVFMGVDPASSQEENRSHSSIVPIALDKDYNIYILPYMRERLAPTDLIAKIKEYYTVNKPLLTTIEENNIGVVIRNILRNSDDIFIPGLGYKHVSTDPKDTRHQRLEPYFYRRKVFMLPWMEEIKSELLIYPRGTRDLIDGLEFATTRMYPPTDTAPIEVTTTKRERMQKKAGGYDKDGWIK